MDQPSDPRAGLSQAEAERRRGAEGANELPRGERRSPLRIVAEVLREPMLQLLLAAGAIYFVLGDIGEGAMLLAFAVLDVGLVAVQEIRSERTLAALTDLTSPRALVLRDGVERRIAGLDVVRGDLLLVSEGDRVAADAVLLDCNDLAVDESLLTGESVPVAKTVGAANASPAAPGGEAGSWIYAGTVIVSGRGMATVRATGARSEIGKIGLSLGKIETADTPLHRQIRHLVVRLAALGVSLSIALFLLYGFLRGGWLEGVLAGITLAMSLLPEEFPVILAVFLVLGAWRIAQQGVLTRRSAAIETLGSATVLCTDKTGTLTENRMAVARLSAGADQIAVGGDAPGPLRGPLARLLRYAVLASEAAPFDPMEKALHDLAARALPPGEAVPAGWRLVYEFGLTPELPAMTHIWAAPGGGGSVVAAKGAPEAIAELAGLSQAARAALAAEVEAMALDGLRVLGVAAAAWPASPWPASPRAFGFEFLGLVGLADPVRQTVPPAIERCRAAGIRVVMVTGDHPVTARAIAREAGIAADRVVTGAELHAMSDAALSRAAAAASVFARVTPVQKHRLVEALKADGEVVAMTGDGVNDAPSLKAAHIGIAMGKRGTDVAREAAALVLLEDDFAAIVAAIMLGRRIYDNLRKAMAYVTGVHVAIAGTALLPILFGWPPLLFPAHIVFLEMIIDPACSIVFEAEPPEEDVLTRPPRDPARPLFGRAMLSRSALQGGGALAATLAATLAARHAGDAEGAVRAAAFAALVLSNLGAILSNRSTVKPLWATLARPNRWLWSAAGIALGALALAIYVPGLNGLFRFAPASPADLGLAALAGAAALIWSELVKRWAPQA